MTRLQKLKDLEVQLSAMMADASARELAPLAKQYRDTLREIEEIEGEEDGDDEIASIIGRSRESDSD